MVLLSASQDLSSIASILQAITGMGTFCLILATFALQHRTFLEQQRLTREQLELSRIEHIKFRKMFMPQLQPTITWQQDIFKATFYFLLINQNNAKNLRLIINNGLLAKYAQNLTQDHLAAGNGFDIMRERDIASDNYDFPLDADVYFENENNEKYVQHLTGTFISPILNPPQFLG